MMIHDLQFYCKQYQSLGGTVMGQMRTGNPMDKNFIYWAARDCRLHDLYGTFGEERYSWFPFHQFSLLPSRLPA